MIDTSGINYKEREVRPDIMLLITCTKQNIIINRKIMMNRKKTTDYILIM